MPKIHKKNKKIARAIRLIWESLDSHLSDAYLKSTVRSKKAKRIIGGRRFHIKCVKEYAEIMKTLSDLL